MKRARGPHIPAEMGWYGFYVDTDYVPRSLVELRDISLDRFPIVAWDLGGGCEPVCPCQPTGGMHFDWLLRPDGGVQGAITEQNDLTVYETLEDFISEQVLARWASNFNKAAEEKAKAAGDHEEELA